jgi:adenosine deaminase
VDGGDEDGNSSISAMNDSNASGSAAAVSAATASTPSAVVVRLLLSINRSGSLADAEGTVDLAIEYMHRGVVGIDLSGDPVGSLFC